MELRDAVKAAGGASALAVHLGLSRGAIYDFIRRGNFAPEHCPEIEKFSGGKVKCETLNTAVDWAYLRTPPRFRAEKSEVPA
ncbi:helix-turn-helix domain-containing protein [Burkholderia multivorans]|nr:helix-turn-helix domain-containing protein [Burkholderia vietnamiensis]MBU9563800.1 helix-turn-helix domain-containing protein [Burkholderia multivorans]MBR8279767.1 helix-turn-helix domain-containing protein [Burkholderia vietnamiensis]MBU9660911.1 helix-turn-helix domain-containing protein [Burkholderia multivorans]HDR8927250.1 helix-turn-helix domain-containing protein [Burkholderia vietnamiensis]